MPSVSRETASESIRLDGLDVRLENLEGGYTVCFESHTADLDMAPLFVGLPDDRCQFPRWGYVVSGQIEFLLRRPRGALRHRVRRTTSRPVTHRFTTRAHRSSSSVPPTCSGLPSAPSCRTWHRGAER